MKVGATFHKFVASSAALDQSLTAACSRPAEGFWSLSTTQRWHPQWMQCFRMWWIWQNQAVFTCFKQPEWGFKQRYNKSDSDPTKCWYLLDVNWCSTNGAVGSKMASQNGWINTKEIQNWWGFEPHFRWFNHVQFQTLLLTLNLHINWLTEQSILCLEKENPRFCCWHHPFLNILVSVVSTLRRAGIGHGVKSSKYIWQFDTSKSSKSSI